MGRSSVGLNHVIVNFYYLLLSIPLLLLSPPNLSAQSPWQERDGLLVVELENVDDRNGWQKATSINGATGGGFLQWTGDQSFSRAGNGSIKFPIRITKPGTYRFEWRVAVNRGNNSTEHNDSWLKINADNFYATKSGSQLKPRPECSNTSRFDCPRGSSTDGFFKIYGGGIRSFQWAARTSDSDAHQIYADFDSPGVYEIEVNARSSYHAIDRLVMYHSSVSSSAARSLDNPESPRGGVSPPVGGGGDVDISGELRKWHAVTLTFDGPNTSETASPNPFSDYALNVTFKNGNRSFVVPGYYATDGNAAETSAKSGNKWRVHFAPDATGTWTYEVSFRKGSNVAVNGGGSSAGFMNGDTGSFNVANTNKTGRDLRGKGRVEYVGEHYLRYAETGEWFVKAGADAPENTLAYEDFDDVPNEGGRRKSWQPHARDYEASEAAEYTWKNGKGSELLGVVNYLSGKGVNALSFLTFNILGDDKNVFPHLLKVSPSNYGGSNAWTSDVHQDRFDVSRLGQWERIFSYADAKGMFLHFKTQETENNKLMDGGNVGRERKLYYRELIARFSHHLALNWNMGEENTQTTSQRIDMAEYFADTDPYGHLRVIHTYPNQQDQVYDALTGGKSDYTGASIQTSNPNQQETFSDTRKWVGKSNDAGQPWVVAVDEPGSANIGVDSDPDDRKLTRHRVVWGNFMAGGAGTEFYYGYQSGCGDLNCQDHRSRDQKYTDAAYALRFFQEHFQPYLPDVSNQNDLTGDTDDFVLTNRGEAIAVYRPNGGSTSITLPSGTWAVSWYNPRDGRLGGANVITGSRITAPDNNDWVALVLPAEGGGCSTAGNSCDDGDACTTNDRVDADCNCTGTPVSGGSSQTLTLAATADAYIQSGRSIDNSELRIEKGRRVTYLKFDVPTSAGSVTDAELTLTVGSDPGFGTIEAFLGENSNWTEGNLAGNAPGEGRLLGSRNETYSGGKSYTWKLTPAAITAGEMTIILRHTSGNDVAMKSSENSTGGDRPVLRLTTSSGGCGALTSPDVSVAGVSDLIPVAVSPNPFGARFQVTLQAGVKDLALYNLLGVRVREFPNIQPGVSSVDVHDLPAGVYLLSATVGGELWSQRLIKR